MNIIPMCWIIFIGQWIWVNSIGYLKLFMMIMCLWIFFTLFALMFEPKKKELGIEEKEE